MIRIAFCGMGSIARGRHLPELLAEKDAAFQGYYVPSPLKCGDELPPTAVCYPSFDHMLQDPAVDAVVITSPNTFHASQSIAAMKAGKDVLCEKPMAISMEEGREMLRTAKETGQVLMIAHNLVLEPAFSLAKKYLTDGSLGRVLFFQGLIACEGPEGQDQPFPEKLWFFQKEKAGGGASLDLAVHGAHAISWLLEEPLTPVSHLAAALDKKTSLGAPIEVEDTCLGLFRTPSGIIGTLGASWCCQEGWRSPITLYCQKGVLHLYPNPDTALEIRYADGSVFTQPSIPKSLWPHGSGVMHAFVEAVVQRTDPQYTAQPALDALEAALSLTGSREG